MRGELYRNEPMHLFLHPNWNQWSASIKIQLEGFLKILSLFFIIFCCSNCTLKYLLETVSNLTSTQAGLEGRDRKFYKQKCAVRAILRPPFHKQLHSQLTAQFPELWLTNWKQDERFDFNTSSQRVTVNYETCRHSNIGFFFLLNQYLSSYYI